MRPTLLRSALGQVHPSCEVTPPPGGSFFFFFFYHIGTLGVSAEMFYSSPKVIKEYPC